MKTCCQCRLTLDESRFAKSKITKDGLTYCCRKCKSKSYRSNVKKDPIRAQKERVRNFKRKCKTRYKLTVEQVNDLFRKANNACQICGNTKKLCIDHCHTTNVIRGILCSGCNLGIGCFQDKKETLVKAIAYLNESGIKRAKL